MIRKSPEIALSVNDAIAVGKGGGIIDRRNSSKTFGWSLIEVCELAQEAYKSNSVPGIIEAEDFDKDCPGEAYFDRDEANTGRQYRMDQGVEIENCNAGG